MQNKTRKQTACKPPQSGPYPCSAAGAGAVAGTPGHWRSSLHGDASAAGTSERAAGAAGWKPPEGASHLVLLHIICLEKNRCDRITLK